MGQSADARMNCIQQQLVPLTTTAAATRKRVLFLGLLQSVAGRCGSADLSLKMENHCCYIMQSINLGETANCRLCFLFLGKYVDSKAALDMITIF